MRFLFCCLFVFLSVGFVYSQELSEKQKAAVQKVVDQTTLVIANNKNQPKRVVRALTDRAEAYKKLRMYDKACADYDSLLEMDGELTDKQYDEACFNYAVMCYELGDFRKAASWFDDVIKSESVPKRIKNEAVRLRNEALKKNMDGSQKNDALVNSPNVSEESKMEGLLARGEQFLRNKEYEKAIADFQTVKNSPKAKPDVRYEAHRLLVTSYEWKEDYEQALKEIETLLASDYVDENNKDDILLRRAHLNYYPLKNSKEAISDCTTVINRNGEARKEALFFRAWCHNWAGENEETIKDCNQLIAECEQEIDGKGDEEYGTRVRIVRGDTYLRMGQDDEALRNYLAVREHKKWNELAPGFKAGMFLNMASIYEKRNDLSSAIDCYTAIIVMDPVASSDSRATAHMGRGQLYLKEGKKDLAANDFRAVENLPDLHQSYKDKAVKLLEGISKDG